MMSSIICTINKTMERKNKLNQQITHAMMTAIVITIMFKIMWR
jgi:hypothetical protein